MADRAHITDIDRIRRFLVDLVLFLEKAGSVLDEVNEEVKRTRHWLQSEQKVRIAAEVRRVHRDLEMLMQQLFAARLSDIQSAVTGQQLLVQKKRKRLCELEAVSQAVASWLRRYDSVVETDARKVESLHHFLSTDMGRAVQFLKEVIRSLDAYQEGESPA